MTLRPRVLLLLLAAAATGEDARPARCRAVVMNSRDGAGFGNHFLGMIAAAAAARACGLPLLLQRRTTTRRICARLACRNASFVDEPRRNGLATDPETVHVDGFRLKPRGHGWGSTTCEPQACLARATGARNRTAALRALLAVDPAAWRPLAPSCTCLLYTSPSPRDGLLSRMPSSA